MAARRLLNRADNVVLPAGTAPDIAVRLVGALLALAVSALHIADQGSMTALASPHWMGWGFRLIEVGGALTAVALLLAPLVPPPSRSARPTWSALTRELGWAAGVLIGAGPFVSYLVSRTVGMPGDPGDVGNWGYWVGTVSLFVEAALVALSVTMLLALRRSGGQQAARSVDGEHPVPQQVARSGDSKYSGRPHRARSGDGEHSGRHDVARSGDGEHSGRQQAARRGRESGRLATRRTCPAADRV